MSNSISPLRPGLTAIAAVLALFSTAAVAQTADTAPPQDAPVISAPSAPADAPVIAAPTSAPATPMQATASDANAIPAAPTAAPMATRSPVVVHTAEAVDDTAVPAAKPAAALRKRPAVVRTAAAEPAPTMTPATQQSAAPKPAPIAMTPPAPAPAAPVVKAATTASSSAVRNDDRTLEIAGIGGLGLIALVGGAFALSRRKRDDEEDAVVVPATVATERTIEEPVAYAPVAPVAVAAAAPIQGAPATALNDQFDLSRYGPHVQMAYRGPTEDNPSLSLRHRLKRARFMDQRAREAGEIAPATATPAEQRRPAAHTLVGARLKDKLGFGGFKPQTGFRPAFN